MPVEITNSIGMKLVLIPPGEFPMGSPKELIEEELKAQDTPVWYKNDLPGEGPRHHVRITRPFCLGTYVVTQEEYQRVVGTNPSAFSATGQNKDRVAGQDTKRYPVETVSWDDAVEFCRRLSNLPEEKAAGRMYQLPSEAQWEYACRAGSTGRYGFSAPGNATAREDDEKACCDYGWFDYTSGVTHAVGLKRASAWGLYDMYGNVWEWCQDWYDKDYYAKSVTDDPAGPSGEGSSRVIRGGSWDGTACLCRSAYHHGFSPGNRSFNLGFRVSLVLPDRPDGRKTVLSTQSTAPQPAVAPFDPPKPKSIKRPGPSTLACRSRSPTRSA